RPRATLSTQLAPRGDRYQLMACLEGRCRRLILTLPPRGLKSLFCSVALPAFALGRDPTQRVICCSYAQDLSAKHARDCRSVMESPWYREVFPRTRIDRARTPRQRSRP